MTKIHFDHLMVLEFDLFLQRDQKKQDSICLAVKFLSIFRIFFYTIRKYMLNSEMDCWMKLIFASILPLLTIAFPLNADSFSYDYVSVGLSKTETRDYLNESFTLSDFDDFLTYHQTIEQQAKWNPTLFLNTNLSFEKAEDINVTQLDGTLGSKYPYSISDRLDINPYIGLHYKYRKICYHTDNCHKSEKDSGYIYGAQIRYWIIKGYLESNISFTKSTLDKRDKWHNYNLLLSLGSKTRIGLGYKEMNWAKELKFTFYRDF